MVFDGCDCWHGWSSADSVGAWLLFTDCGVWVDWLSTSLCVGWVVRGPSVCCVGGESTGSAGSTGSTCGVVSSAYTSATVCSSTGFSGQLFLLWPIWQHMLHFFLWPPLLICVLSFLNSHFSNLPFFLDLFGKIFLYGGWTSR